MASTPSATDGSSVMEQMLKLFEPPGGYQADRETEQHPYFKRPGRGHNHDTCDSCREGGALLCCDSCPASFHLQCHDPPLEDSDIPEGDWICIKCFIAKPEAQRPKKWNNEKCKVQAKKVEKCDLEEFDKEKTKSAEKDKPKTKDRDWRPKKRKPEEEEDSRPKRATRMLKKTKYNDNSTEEEYSESDFYDVEIPKQILQPKVRTYLEIYREHLDRKPRATSTFFQTLLDAAAIRNAEEFNLPKSIHVPEKFPYAWKWSTSERRLRNQTAEDTDSRGKVKLCYVCVKSSRLGPLIQCDFCPCLFHMDCLDPPLAEIPSDVWMCPNHVESLLDSRLTSTRVTERINLWDKFASQPIDTHAVKIQFMKKCARKKRVCKLQTRTVASAKRIQVPEYIKQQYNRPPSLLPGPGYERWLDPALRRHPRQTSVDYKIRDRYRLPEDDHVAGVSRLNDDDDVGHSPKEEDEHISRIYEQKSHPAVEPADKDQPSHDVLSEKSEDSKGPNTVTQDLLDRDATTQDSTEQDATTEDTAPKESEVEDAATENSPLQNAATQNSAAEDAATEKSAAQYAAIENSSAESSQAVDDDGSSKEDKETSQKQIESLQESHLKEDSPVDDDSQKSSAISSPPISDENKPPSSSSSYDPDLSNDGPAVADTLFKPMETEELGNSAIVQKPSAPIEQLISAAESDYCITGGRGEQYSQDELEWVSSIVSLQTALLRKKLGQEDSLQCKEKIPSQDQFEENPLERSPDSSTVSGISLSGKIAGEQQLMDQLQDYLITHTEVENLDQTVLKYLAAKQIQKILPTRITQLQSNVKARASLTPIGSRKQPFYMQYRTVDIGTGADTQLNLRDFGHCNMLSDRHATLFYDELSGQYEMLNYSVHGTMVDECMYSLDIACVAQRYKKRVKGNPDLVVMAGPAASLTPCYCSSSLDPSSEGFEGSALLHHGSRVKFGCLEFVFSVASVMHG